MTPAVSSLLIVIGLWLTVAFFCCAGGRYAGSDAHKVTYRVDGRGRASLTYANASGGTEQHEVSLPWTISFNGQYGEFLYLSAQNKTNATEIVTSISINGRVVKDATSSEDYGIATVSDMCCK
jgi:hypothetical protein